MRAITAEQFLADVSKHEMKIALGSGVYRHVRFASREHGWNLWFEILTWPGSLTIHGDMGSWTFSRVPDMFTFFRSRGELKINPDYWAEKLRASSEDAKKFDADTFREQLLGRLDGYDLSPELHAEVVKALKEVSGDFEYEHEAYRAASGFAHRHAGGVFQFDCADLPSGKIWTYRYLWNLYAIVWTIQQWDAGRPGIGGGA